MLIGIVGKTNCGKSTFFKAATLAEVEIANRPFVTIKPNSGVGFVRVDCAEKSFNVKCKPKHGFCLDGQRFVPFDLLDVAGLIPGAHQGKGLGSQFLDDLRQADALIHLIDVSGSTNELGEHVPAASYNPSNDILFLEDELDMWFFSLVEKGWSRFARQVDQEHLDPVKAVSHHLSGLGVSEDLVKALFKRMNLPPRIIDWDSALLKTIAVELRKATKPMIIAANKIDVPGAADNLKRLQKEFPGRIIVGCSAESELALREAAKHGLIDYIPGDPDFRIKDPSRLNDSQKDALGFIKENVLAKFSSTGVQQVLNDAVFRLLNRIAVYPVANTHLTDKDGNMLPDCYLVPAATTAHQFAYRIHSQIGDSFVRAIDLRTKKVVGKDHGLKNGDVMEIVCNK